MSTTDVTAEDALHIAKRALRKANEVDDLRDNVDELDDELTALKCRLSERDDDTAYESLTLEEKVGMVREHGYKKASNGHGRAMLDYSDVMWEVFDGEPGNNHCYKLIRLAAGLEDADTGSETPGFTARDPDGQSYHLAIDAAKAKAEFGFYPRNKTEQAGAD